MHKAVRVKVQGDHMCVRSSGGERRRDRQRERHATIPAPPQTDNSQTYAYPCKITHLPGGLLRGGCCPPCGAAAGCAGRAMRSRAPRLGVGSGGHGTGTSRDDSGRHSNERSGVQRSAERFLPVQAGRLKVSSHQWQLLEQPGAGRSSRPCYKTTLRRHKRRLAPHSALTSSGLCRLAADPRRCQARLHR